MTMNSSAAESHSTTNADGAVAGSSQSRPSAAGASATPSDGVQPLPEQTRKQQRLSCLLDSLAVVELQLAMQFLDADGKLTMVRCSRRLLHAASHPFAWKAAPPFVVEARMAADVERIVPSLLQFAPIHLRCIELASLDCVTAIPHLRGLGLLESPQEAAAGLTQLLQHPCAERLQTLRLDDTSSQNLLSVNSMRLIVRLPQLRTLDVWMHDQPDPSAALLQPLAEAPALTHLALSWPPSSKVTNALLDPIARIASLRRLALHGLAHWSGETSRSFFSSPNIRQLQHLELRYFFASPTFSFQAPSADDHQVAFSALQQLQSLTLHSVWGISRLLPHLRPAPPLRLLSIGFRPDNFMHAAMQGHYAMQPSRFALAALLATAPQLEVQLLLPPSLDRWLPMYPSMDPATRSMYEEQWHELHRWAAELERVAIAYEESEPSRL